MVDCPNHVAVISLYECAIVSGRLAGNEGADVDADADAGTDAEDDNDEVGIGASDTLESSSFSHSSSLEGDPDLVILFEVLGSCVRDEEVEAEEEGICEEEEDVDADSTGKDDGKTLECQLCLLIVTKSGSSIGKAAADILESLGRPPFHHNRPVKGRTS